MKKILLLASVAIVAITANAQKLVRQDYALDLSKHVTIEKTTQLTSDMSFAVKKTGNTIASKVQKAPTLEEITAKQFVQVNNFEVPECVKAEIVPENNIIEGENGEQIECNVVVRLNFQEGTNVGDFYFVNAIGKYDAEEGTISVPAQYMIDPTGLFDSNFILLGVKTYEDSNFSYDDLVFYVDESGALFLDSHVAFFVLIADGEYKGQWISNGVEVSLMPINAVQTGYENSFKTGSKWGETAYNVAVEDFDTSINVYGFCGSSKLTMDVNEDLSVSIPTQQLLYDFGIDDAAFETYGYGRLWSTAIQGESLMLDAEAKVIMGTLTGNTITIDDPVSEGYFWISSAADEAGQIYFYGLFTNQSIMLNEGNYVAGIQNVTATREEQIKNTKTYNLMGQQVNRDQTRGLMIRNGKKYIKK